MARLAAVTAAVAILGAGAAPASPWADSLTTLRIADPARKNRQVTAKLCVPSTPPPWPLYVFGHGFDCAAADYAYFCEIAATAMVYHNEVAALDLDTANLAKDASFLAATLPEQSKSDPSSPLYGKLGGPVVLGGHSMGGGTSILSAATKPAAAGMAVFAPGLYTIPSAKPYLPNVTMPSLIVSGADDCGMNALPREAQPAYDGLSSPSKVLVVLKGANHCHWVAATELVGVCKFPECSRIPAAEQHALGVQLAKAFFGALEGEAGWNGFESFLADGEKNGTWTYVSSKTSPPTKKLHNDCPCKPAAEEVVV